MRKNKHWFYSDNPSPQQRRNRREFRKWWRSFKKEGELMIPFLIGIIVIGAVGYLTVLHSIS